MKEPTSEELLQRLQEKEKEYLESPLTKRLEIAVSSFKVHWKVRKYYKRGWLFKTLMDCIKLVLKKTSL